MGFPEVAMKGNRHNALYETGSQKKKSPWVFLV